MRPSIPSLLRMHFDPLRDAMPVLGMPPQSTPWLSVAGAQYYHRAVESLLPYVILNAQDFQLKSPS